LSLYRYIPDRDFKPDIIKNVSRACEGLCKWVRAMEVYDRVIKIVAPKKANLAKAEAELAVQMDRLNEKRAQLQEVWTCSSLSLSVNETEATSVRLPMISNFQYLKPVSVLHLIYMRSWDSIDDTVTRLLAG